MVYPYQTVYAFTKEKSGLLAHICDECLAELIEKTNALKNE